MDIALPELGENIEEAEVLNVLVRAGDAVAQDQPVLELETDKATFELPSPEAGTVSAVHVKKGDTVRVGQKVISLDAGAPARDGADARTARSTSRDASHSREADRGDERDADDIAPSARRESAQVDRDDARPRPARDGDADDGGPSRRDQTGRGGAARRSREGAVARERAGASRPGDAPSEERDDVAADDGDGAGTSRRDDAPGDVRHAAARARRRHESDADEPGDRGRAEPDDVSSRDRDDAPARRRGGAAVDDREDTGSERRRTPGVDDREDRRGASRRDDADDDRTARDETDDRAARDARREPDPRAGDDRARRGRAAEQADAESAPGRDRHAGDAVGSDRGERAEVADDEVAAGPMARRLAREHGADLARIRGTGSGGRITPEDVQAFVRAQASAGRDSRGAERSGGGAHRRPLSGIQKAAARHLARSWSDIPHVTHHDLADVTEMEEARIRYEAERGESGAKLTWTALVVKAVVAGLKRFPDFNSRLDLERQELVRNRGVHVGIAVDTEHGLLVPVVRDADRMTTGEIAAEVARLAERARERKLGRDDMQGAGMTVTNLGGIGGVAFTPIINPPEVAILGVARGRDDVAWRDGSVVRRIVLPLSLSYDHRAIDGAAAARFVRHVAGLLEDPVRLLIES